MCEKKFYVCERCGNLVELVEKGGGQLVCCGQKMTCLEAGVVEASREKHIPVVTVNGNVVRVSVGSVAHPMGAEHYIGWVYLVTDKGIQRKPLTLDGASECDFVLAEAETPLAAYAWCNLHGLWKAEI